LPDWVSGSSLPGDWAFSPGSTPTGPDYGSDSCLDRDFFPKRETVKYVKRDSGSITKKVITKRVY